MAEWAVLKCRNHCIPVDRFFYNNLEHATGLCFLYHPLPLEPSIPLLHKMWYCLPFLTNMYVLTSMSGFLFHCSILYGMNFDFCGKFCGTHANLKKLVAKHGGGEYGWYTECASCVQQLHVFGKIIKKKNT